MEDKPMPTGANDSDFLDPNVKPPKIVNHGNIYNALLALGNKQEGMKILEIGSREVTSESRLRKMFPNAEYVGFDYYSGENVDVVGDAHKLSSYFKEEEKFDLIYSLVCFEHFAMPWKVAEEINKLLKVGGFVVIETHFSYSSHERPWHFFQFSDLALKVLFSPAMGFLCVDSGMSNPLVGRFSQLAEEYLRGQGVPGLYCHSEFLGQKIKEAEDFSWDKVSLEDVVGNTRYPQGKVVPEEDEK